VAAAVRGLDRSTRSELVVRHPLGFPTHHPQGLAFADGRTFVSSVEITEEPRRGADPAERSTGAGVGHLFVMEDGRLVRDLILGEGAAYHPGGIDFDGSSVWLSVAEYRSNSRSIVVSVDPVSLEIRERFRVADHVGWVVRDPSRDVIYGGTWGSRRFYTWTPDGREARNPFAATMDDAGLRMHVAPNDGGDLGGTELLSYRVARPSG
jgi:Family of unknown function (DUF6454)